MELSEEAWQRLQSVYESPQDIELFPAGLLETASEDGKLGPTFSCIIAKQFFHLKFGDRYFFTHDNVDISLCPNDLKIIRKRTLRDVICDNTDIQSLPLSVFAIPSASNPIQECPDGKVGLEPSQLCLFGSKTKASKLKNPGYVSQGIPKKKYM